jgi:3-deoxy-D-manno-octulosonate 8-phosphate phosphatase KdsC-like HAD superfamily phosphatase
MSASRRQRDAVLRTADLPAVRFLSGDSLPKLPTVITAIVTMSFCPVDCAPCADAECRAVCKKTGGRRLDICEECGELLEIQARIRICTQCITRSPPVLTIDR